MAPYGSLQTPFKLMSDGYQRDMHDFVDKGLLKEVGTPIFHPTPFVYAALKFVQ
jgi:hypothetical protein